MARWTYLLSLNLVWQVLRSGQVWVILKELLWHSFLKTAFKCSHIINFCHAFSTSPWIKKLVLLFAFANWWVEGNNYLKPQTGSELKGIQTFVFCSDMWSLEISKLFGIWSEEREVSLCCICIHTRGNRVMPLQEIQLLIFWNVLIGVRGSCSYSAPLDKSVNVVVLLV